MPIFSATKQKIKKTETQLYAKRVALSHFGIFRPRKLMLKASIDQNLGEIKKQSCFPTPSKEITTIKQSSQISSAHLSKPLVFNFYRKMRAKFAVCTLRWSLKKVKKFSCRIQDYWGESEYRTNVYACIYFQCRDTNYGPC